MKTVANVLWLIFPGLWTALAWIFIGAIWCITIIGIPFGKQAFKLARLALWPFGTNPKVDFAKHPIANILWLIFGGFDLAVGYVGAGIFWCITIIGIPFGLQCFKMAVLALLPFGAKVK